MICCCWSSTDNVVLYPSTNSLLLDVAICPYVITKSIMKTELATAITRRNLIIIWITFALKGYWLQCGLFDCVMFVVGVSRANYLLLALALLFPRYSLRIPGVWGIASGQSSRRISRGSAGLACVVIARIKGQSLSAPHQTGFFNLFLLWARIRWTDTAVEICRQSIC